MDALEKAKSLVEIILSDSTSLEGVAARSQLVMAYAAIAQAEQLKRIADANERQAIAVERRNEILEEYNKVSHEQHLIYRSEVIDFLRQFFHSAESGE